MAVAAEQIPPDPSRDERSDQELVAGANGGDAAAFETLYRRYRDWVVGLAYRYTRDRELALDVLQETFVYVLGKFPGFELRSEMKTFLYPTVRHLSVALQSKATRRPPETGSLKFELPPDPWLHQCLVAYASDLSLIDTICLPHDIGVLNTGYQFASLDHAMWFHRPFRADQWLLYTQESPIAAGARGFASGRLFNREGQLVVSVVQEGLIRPVRPR